MDLSVLLPFLPELLLLLVLIWMTVLLLLGLVGMASFCFCSRFIHPEWFSGPFGVVILSGLIGLSSSSLSSGEAPGVAG